MSQPLYSNLGFEQPLEMAKGSTFKLELRMFADTARSLPFDLTGCEVRATVQGIADPSVKVAFAFETDLGEDGVARGTLSADKSMTLVANDRRMAVPMYRWACEIRTPDGDILPYCWGTVAVRSNGVDW